MQPNETVNQRHILSLFQITPQIPHFQITIQMLNRWQKESLRDEGQKVSTPVLVGGKTLLPACRSLLH